MLGNELQKNWFKKHESSRILMQKDREAVKSKCSTTPVE